MIAEFYKVLLTLYYISHLSCQRQLTTRWKLGFTERALHYDQSDLVPRVCLFAGYVVA
jgi:hypothetical protein